MTLIIGSWNYPFSTIIPGLISSIAAGNPCIIKPSEHSKNSSNLLKKILSELDNNFFYCFEGGVETSIFLCKMPFDHLIFTGSSRTGKFIRNDSCIDTKLTLELGGRNHCIIDKEANLD